MPHIEIFFKYLALISFLYSSDNRKWQFTCLKYYKKRVKEKTFIQGHFLKQLREIPEDNILVHIQKTIHDIYLLKLSILDK